MNKAYLLIGGNMGNREEYLHKARKKIEESCGTIVKQSSLYQTEAWGLKEQDAFLNQALEINTGLNAIELIKKILFIEESIGRMRSVKYGPRTIDIDILLFNDDVVNEEVLTIPHPEMQNRRFVLTPLNEIAAKTIHPVFHKTIEQLLRDCSDKSDVHKI